MREGFGRNRNALARDADFHLGVHADTVSSRQVQVLSHKGPEACGLNRDFVGPYLQKTKAIVARFSRLYGSGSARTRVLNGHLCVGHHRPRNVGYCAYHIAGIYLPHQVRYGRQQAASRRATCDGQRQRLDLLFDSCSARFVGPPDSQRGLPKDQPLMRAPATWRTNNTIGCREVVYTSRAPGMINIFDLTNIRRGTVDDVGTIIRPVGLNSGR